MGTMERADILASLREHHVSAYGWALHCCAGDRWDAEGVLHDVYIEVLQGKGEFRGESQPRTWLFALIRNTARKRRRRLLRRLGLLQKRLLGSQEGQAPPAEEALEQAQRRKRLLALLEKLPARQRETLHLVFYQELSLREAAEVMGVSLGSVRVHYHRGKATLRKYVEESGLDYGRSWRESDPEAVR